MKLVVKSFGNILNEQFFGTGHAHACIVRNRIAERSGGLVASAAMTTQGQERLLGRLALRLHVDQLIDRDDSALLAESLPIAF